jgi:hypothetical protein
MWSLSKLRYKEGVLLLSYLFLLFPNVMIDGILKNEPLLGDPFYMARMKHSNSLANYSELLYAKNDSPLNGQTEIISLGELLISKISMALGLSLPNSYVYSSIFFGLLILLLFQLILKQFSITSVKSLVLSICMIFVSWGPFFPYNLERPVSPQIILSLWLLIILCCIKSIRNPSISAFVITGIIIGSSIYFHYPYIFLQIQAGIIVFVISMIAKKQSFKGFVISILISWIVATPYLFWSVRANYFPEYKELLLRNGLIETHIPHAIRTFLISLVAFTLILIILKQTKQSLDNNRRTMILLLGSFAIGTALASNSNLISGKAIQFSDHFEVFIKVIIILSISILAKYLSVLDPLKRLALKLFNENSYNVISTLFLVASFTFATNASANVGVNSKTIEIIDWLRDNIPIHSDILIEDIGIANASSPLLQHKLLTNSDITNYSFHQKEINQRYFANSGCHLTSVDDATYRAIYTFRGVAGTNTGRKVLQFLKRVDSLPALQKSIDNFLTSQSKTNKELKKEGLGDFLEVKATGCISFIKSRGVEYILVSSEKNWLQYIKSGKIEFFSNVGELSIYSVT